MEIITGNDNIIELDLRFNQVSDKVAGQLASSPNICKLNINNNYLTETGIIELAKSKSLTHLQFSHQAKGNRISADAKNKVAKMLTANNERKSQQQRLSKAPLTKSAGKRTELEIKEKHITSAQITFFDSTSTTKPPVYHGNSSKGDCLSCSIL